MNRIAVKVLLVAVFAVAAIAAQAQTTCPVAQLTSPTPGSTLPGSTVTFSWCNASGDYFLTVESLLGSHNIFNAVVRVNTITLINLPTNGGTIYLTLWTQLGGVWQHPFNYTFTAASAGSPSPQTAPSFSLNASTTGFSLAPGQSATSSVTMTPSNGFDGTVTLGCAGLPANVTCRFSPAQLVGNGSPAVATMTVSVAAAAAANHQGRSGLLLAFWSLGAGAFGMVFAGTGTRRRTKLWVLLGCALISLVLLAGCGGAYSAPATQSATNTPAPAAPQPATGPQTVSGAVTAAAAGGLNAAVNPNQQFQIQVTLLP
jgi:hypothetical protein